MAKTLIEATGIEVDFGLRRVLCIDRFTLMEGERVGLVGENGAGKTTLLRVLLGEIVPDAGSVRAFAPLGYIAQSDAERGEEAGLSGGERTKMRVEKAMRGAPGALLADEPTSDLDWKGLEELESALLKYPGGLILVSHDRALLEKVCTRIACLEDGKLTLFPGGYAAWREQRARERLAASAKYEQYQRERARLKQSMQRQRERADQVKKAPGRMGNSEARLHRREATEASKRLSQARGALSSRLEMLKDPGRPRDEPDIRMAMGAISPPISRAAIKAKGLNLNVPGRNLLSGAEFVIPTGSRTVVLGPNGCGKSTLASHIMSGGAGVRTAPGLNIGWFQQGWQALPDPEATALECAAPPRADGQAAARAILARLGLRGEAVFKRAGMLSGGERARVALARLMAGGHNCLLLDEPTNHLDIDAMEALEDMLLSYEGTLILITHDRHMAEAVGNRLLIFEGNGIRAFEGGLARYRQREREAGEAANRAMERTMLDMRLAFLAGRISSPRRGEDVAALRREYDEVLKMKKSLAE